MIYDMIMRVPYLFWVVYMVILQVIGLIGYTKATPLSAGLAIHFAMRLSTIMFLSLMASLTILRTRPTAKAVGLEPRLSALTGTFLSVVITFFPRHDLSIPIEVVATLFTMAGFTGASIALSQLGRSFSIMAESRQLVTSGLYRCVRHPLYLTEEIAIFGVFIQFASIWTALILIVQIAFQLRRMHNEETILNTMFPEYASYRQTTARLVPGVY